MSNLKVERKSDGTVAIIVPDEIFAGGTPVRRIEDRKVRIVFRSAGVVRSLAKAMLRETTVTEKEGS